MTDRPRVYAATRVRHPNGGETSFAEPVTLIEWDRAKAVRAIESAVLDYVERAGAWDARLAEAIFDALDREQT